MNDEEQPAPNLLSRQFAGIADHVARVTGHPLTFMLSCAAIGIWAIASAVLKFTDAWQTPIDTVTTIVTFLMVFLIQSTQNRDGVAVQAKLDELIRALEPANNKFIAIEKRTIEEVHELRQETADEVKLMDELIVDVAIVRDHLEAAPAIPPEKK